MTKTTASKLAGRFRRNARRWIGKARNQIAARSSRYQSWLADHIQARQGRLQLHAAPGQFSFLTGIYEGTPPELFRETAAAVFAQTSAHFEWVLLAHGPIPAALQTVLSDVSRDSRVRLIRLDENRGIMGGMRTCLEAATGQYVIPLDSDDLLISDALQVSAQALHDHSSPKFIYTDEDHFSNGRPRDPFLRPDWDPILNQSSSYIWHLCAYDRQAALDLGVYSDCGAEYCHDWDTLFRFARAGYHPVHIPEVVYHWRSHPASHTNRRSRHQGSLHSQRHVLQQHVSRQSSPEFYDVCPFPLDRGAEEWWIRRKPLDPPAVDCIHHSSTSAATQPQRSFPFRNLICAANNAAEVCDRLRASTADYVVIAAAELELDNEDWMWEAIGLFELHPDLALIAGRIVNRSGIVTGGGLIEDDSGGLHCPELGRDADEPGPFALWMKPRSVAGVDPRLFIVRNSFVQLVHNQCFADEVSDLARQFCEAARKRDFRIATSPLISATEMSIRS